MSTICHLAPCFLALCKPSFTVARETELDNRGMKKKGILDKALEVYINLLVCELWEEPSAHASSLLIYTANQLS
jgi:hypothetical protein